jgi:SAM-dependent methyltransferase
MNNDQGLGVCPCCASADMELICRYRHSVTSDAALADSPITNLLCRTCGLLSNGLGARGQETGFYSDDYNLLGDAGDAEFVYETDQGARGVNTETVDYIGDKLSLGSTGAMIDVGCGKGLLLKAFAAGHGGWSLSGVEPSRHARGFMTKLMPDVPVHGGPLDTSALPAGCFDLVSCTGVLEHVPDPVAFARQLAGLAKPDGNLFLSVPNFENNPADLLTYDHLSRFTPASLEQVLGRAGLRIVDLRADSRVPMWVIARPGEPAAARVDDGSGARAAAAWLEGAMAVFDTLDRQPGARVGVYGTGLTAIAAVALQRFHPDKVVAFFDDNTHLHGAQRLGRPVHRLDAAARLGVTDIAFSANPVYLPRMEAKVRALYPQLRIWPLPAMSAP